MVGRFPNIFTAGSVDRFTKIARPQEVHRKRFHKRLKKK
jgi:hypothetical protein